MPPEIIRCTQKTPCTRVGVPLSRGVAPRTPPSRFAGPANSPSPGGAINPTTTTRDSIGQGEPSGVGEDLPERDAARGPPDLLDEAFSRGSRGPRSGQRVERLRPLTPSS